MTIPTRNRRLCSLGLLAALGAVSGCTLGPKYHPPTAPKPVAENYKESTVNFQNAPGWKVAQPSAPMLKGKWWEIFNDPELNQLEDQALAASPDAKTQAARLKEAIATKKLSLIHISEPTRP